MLKKYLPTLVTVVLFAASTVFGQSDQAELTALQTKLRPRLVKDDYEEIIPLAVKILEIQKASGTPAEYETALRNLANWRLKRQTELFTVLKDKKPKETKDNFELGAENFRELAAITAKTGDPLKLASVKVELADFLYSFAPSDVEAATIYAEALAIREKVLPLDSESVLVLVDNLSWIYLVRGDFERFYPLNRRYVREMEKRYGPSDQRLAAPLTAYSWFLTATDQDAEAESIAARIRVIAGNPNFKPPRWDVVRYRSLAPIKVELQSPFSRGTTISESSFSMPNPFAVRNNAITIGSGTQAIRTQASHTTAGSITFTGNAGPSNSTSGAKFINVKMLIDEDGKVIEVTGLSGRYEIKEVPSKVRRVINDLKFRPLVVEGRQMKMWCWLTFYY